MLARLSITDSFYRPVGSYILVPLRDQFETLVMRQAFGLKKYQRGIMQMFGAGCMVPAAGGTVPSVTDIVIVHTTSPNIAGFAGIVYNQTSVGSVEELVKRQGNLVYTVMGNDDAGSPVDHTGEWTSDSVTAADWEVACVAENSGSWDVSHASVGSYTTFATADMDWHEFRTGGKGYTAGNSRVFADFRIREVATPGNFTEFEVDANSIQDP